MPRRVLDEAAAKERRRKWAAEQIAGDCKKRKRSSVSAKKLIDRFIEEASRLDDWSTAEPKHFVGQHARLHLSIYGVVDEALAKKRELLSAVGAARRLLEGPFHSVPERMVEYLRWVWLRERATEKKRRANGDGAGRRMTWRVVFLWPERVTDYRVYLQRKREGARA